VEIVVAEVGDDRFAGNERNAIYRVKFDGFISDHEGYCVIGGSADSLEAHLRSQYQPKLPLGDVVRLGKATLERANNGGARVEVRNLEVALLDRRRSGRKFRRLSAEELAGILGG
jgi:proteasome alpha subunit